MKQKVTRRQRRKLAIAACGLLVGAWTMQSCDDGLLTGQPSWLGNSIYERLEEDGNYKTTLRLIDDLDLHQVMSQTGSKTLFAADDDAYQQWYQNNSWGVRSYEQLSNAQKKLLLNNTMVDNAYLIELLSNVTANPPEEGKSIRHETSTSIYDSVYIMKPDKMPRTMYWDRFRNISQGIPLMKDATKPPMIHFLPAYMSANQITDNDLSILTNGGATSVSEAWVNGVKVVDRDITCKNGYIQKTETVVEGLPNMAEILRQHKNMSQWSELIDRFSAPYRSDEATKEYNRLVGNTTSTDSVYVLRYFSDQSVGGKANNTDPDGVAVEATLPFDPGWNQYIYKAGDEKVDYHYDAGAMLVPSNEALQEWWDKDGRALRDEYGVWDSVPAKTLSKLLNVHMMGTFTTAVPSKFADILDNDSKVPLGVKPEDVDSCFIGCNGVVYMMNRVYSPAAYASVSFPALIHQETMNIIYYGIEACEFEPYLNSMDSYYSFIIPSNLAMLNYVDPCSYGDSQQTMLEFYFDNEAKKVYAHRYRALYNAATHTWEKGDRIPGADLKNETVIKNRLNDILNSLIIVGDVEDGHTYYKTKGGNMVKVTNSGQLGAMTVAGGLQVENGKSLPVTTIYDMRATGNGKSYVVDEQVPMTTNKSVYKLLSENPEYSEFMNLLYAASAPDSAALLISQLSKRYDAVDNNIKLFETYNYTVYVPTNETIHELHDKGYLPNWEDFDAQTASVWGTEEKAKEVQKIIVDRIMNFVRYHIQDNSVLIDGEEVYEDDEETGQRKAREFESALLNPDNHRFYTLKVNADKNNLTITDLTGQTVNVKTDGGLYNQLCREYWFQGEGTNKIIYTASDAVVHQIDKALFYDKQQMTPWRNEIKR